MEKKIQRKQKEKGKLGNLEVYDRGTPIEIYIEDIFSTIRKWKRKLKKNWKSMFKRE